MKNKKSKTLIIEIGNTSATLGVYAGNRLSHFKSYSHVDIPKFIRYFASGGKNCQIDVVLSSVVPKMSQKVRQCIRSIKRASLWEVGRNLKLPVKHSYRPKKSLGIDRLISVYGATKLFKPPLLVVDFGTAITFDYVSKDGAFEGGMIVPGPEISFQALLERAALIPKRLRLPKKGLSFLGNSTYACIKTGILEGYGALADEIIARFKKRYGKNLKIIVTGGFAAHLKPYARSLKRQYPKLGVESLKKLLDESRKNGS